MPNNVNTNNIFHTSLNDDYSNTIIGGNYATDTITIGAMGAMDTSYTWSTGTTGINAIDWSNISVNTSISQSGLMELKGDNADIKINGRSLTDAIEALEQRLNILVPNPELEKEWDELRELGNRYRELEKQCKEKGEMWNKLKTMPPLAK
jgi:hypothetical protein